MSTGLNTELAAIRNAAQILVTVHGEMQDEFGLIKRRREELYNNWQSAKTAPQHQALFTRFDQAFEKLQMEIEDIKQLIATWEATVTEGIASSDQILAEAEQLAGSFAGAGAGGAGPAGGGGGYLELISSGETVAGR